jgi:dienelactone hydrolase
MRQLLICTLALLFVSAASLAQAKVTTKTVSYKHGDQELEGVLAWDDAVEGKRPGVLVVHEWWGLNDYARDRAKQLAGMGYVAFAVDMYGKGKLTKHPDEAKAWATQVRSNAAAWNERGRLGLEILQKNELVDPKRVAAIGYCFGGSTVLTLALGGADLAAVASFHGALPPADKAQAEKIKGKVLICHGAADKFIPEEVIQKFRAALDEGGTDWQMVYYSGAQHSFTVPDADKAGVPGIKYDKHADERSWKHLKVMLDEAFK